MLAHQDTRQLNAAKTLYTAHVLTGMVAMAVEMELQQTTYNIRAVPSTQCKKSSSLLLPEYLKYVLYSTVKCSQSSLKLYSTIQIHININNNNHNYYYYLF